MATIKSFTDLEQSKKLTEILPLESADMFLAMNGILPVMSKYIDDGLVTADETAIPCWSLAALINILPRIDIEKEICSDDTYDYRVKAYIGDGYIGDWFDNSIDACYEMILKLKEQNLL